MEEDIGPYSQPVVINEADMADELPCPDNVVSELATVTDQEVAMAQEVVSQVLNYSGFDLNETTEDIFFQEESSDINASNTTTGNKDVESKINTKDKDQETKQNMGSVAEKKSNKAANTKDKKRTSIAPARKSCRLSTTTKTKQKTSVAPDVAEEDLALQTSIANESENKIDNSDNENSEQLEVAPDPNRRYG